MSKHARLSLASVLLLAACGESHSAAGGAHPQDFLAAYCQYVARCDEGPRLGALGGSVARCTEFLATPGCYAQQTELRGVDGSEACAAALPGAACEHLHSYFGIQAADLCTRVQSPLAGEGASCVAATCAPGLLCAGSIDCPTCERPVDDGTACGHDDYAAFCGEDSTCDSGTCAPLRAVGEACERPSQCLTRRCDAGVCAARLPAGSACARPTDCEAGPCLDGVCSGTAGRLGEPCTEDSQCRNDMVCVGGKCAASACLVQDGCRCPDDQACPFGSNECKPRIAPLAPCEPDGIACAIDHHCDVDEKRCLPLPAEGASCARVPTCARGTFCDSEDWVCKAPKPDGESCRSDSHCAGNHCWQGRCGPAECPP